MILYYTSDCVRAKRSHRQWEIAGCLGRGSFWPNEATAGGVPRQIPTNSPGGAVGTLIESLALAAIGGVIGAALTYAIFDGLSASTLGGNFTQVVFNFRLSPTLVGEGVLLALIVGLIGGLFPALRAARMPIVAGLYA